MAKLRTASIAKVISSWFYDDANESLLYSCGEFTERHCDITAG